jgi:hypothetical protein
VSVYRCIGVSTISMYRFGVSVWRIGVSVYRRFNDIDVSCIDGLQHGQGVAVFGCFSVCAFGLGVFDAFGRRVRAPM